jgi:hypothetical protein
MLVAIMAEKLPIQRAENDAIACRESCSLRHRAQWPSALP